MFAFRNQEKVCWHQCLYTHCLKKKKKKNFNYQQRSHGPILSQANKSGLSISQNWFSGDVLQKDEMRLMQHRKAQRVRLSRAYKERGTVSLTLFVVPQFLVRSLARFRAHTWKLATFSACTKPNYNHKCTHTHIHALPWELQVSITSKHLQCDEKLQLRGVVIGQHSYWMVMFPSGSPFKVSHHHQEGLAVPVCSSNQSRLSEVPLP